MRYDLQVGEAPADDKRCQINVRKEGFDVDLYVNGELVAWFNFNGEFVIDQEAMEGHGLKLRAHGGGEPLHDSVGADDDD